MHKRGKARKREEREKGERERERERGGEGEKRERQRERERERESFYILIFKHDASIILYSQLTSLRQNILVRRFTRFTSGLISYKNELTKTVTFVNLAKRLTKIFCLRLVNWE